MVNNKQRIWGYTFAALLFIVIFAGLVALIVYDFDNPATIFGTILAILVIDFFFAAYIMASQRYTIIKLCWVFVVLAFPMIGVIIFLIFGTTPFKRKEWNEYNKFQAHFIKHEKFYPRNQLPLTTEEYNVFSYVKNNSFRPIYKWNSIKIIASNSNLYKESIKLLLSAQEHIHIQMYIIHDGFWWKTVQKILIDKAKQGVKVRIIYDWVGCLNRLPRKDIKNLRKNGIEIVSFNPHGINVFKGSTNYRSHCKAIIVDNKKAIFGGSNIGDEYLSVSKDYNYFSDLNFMISGEIVNSLNLLFCQHYCFFSEIKKGSKEFDEIYNNLNKILVPKKATNTTCCQLVDSSPEYQGKSVKNSLVNLILKANKSIDIVSPYFVPTEDVLDALIIASRTGIKIRIIFPGKCDDKAFTRTINRSYYQRLLDAKIKIYEHNGFIHSKVLIIDNKIIFTGSFNLDYRSLWINFENGLIIKDLKLANNLDKTFKFYLSNSIPIDKKIADKYFNFWHKIQINLMEIFYPLL